MSSLELLMPAGSPRKLELALDYGADAIYLGPPQFSLRARENDFTTEEIDNAIRRAHILAKKAYLALNIFARNRKLKSFTEALKAYAEFQPDAFIVSDPGLAVICQEIAPQIPLHLSVQANCTNWQAVKFWNLSLGIQRVILSRELSIAEIAEIKQRVPEVELEAFVHGSICIAYSGRCLLSSYMSRRDANQGVCDNSCREKFKLFSESENFLEDQRDPGSRYPIEEDEHGTYILNAKDLCMIDHLKELTEAGVVSFKVEGRTKSEFYAAMIARSYRGALDDLQGGRPLNPYWRAQLDRLSNRGFHTAFMFQDPSDQGQNYETSHAKSPLSQFVGLVQGISEQGRARVDIKNRLAVGQQVEIISPNSSHENPVLTKVTEIWDEQGKPRSQVHSGSGVFSLQFESSSPLVKNSLLVSDQDRISPGITS